MYDFTLACLAVAEMGALAAADGWAAKKIVHMMIVGAFVIGLILLVLDEGILVRGATRLAAIAGISILVIGLTVVAYGTSSPEMAVSVGSAYSGQADTALDNVVGSNIFNVLLVLGLSRVVSLINVAEERGMWLWPRCCIARRLFAR